MKDKQKKIGFSYAWNGILETIKTESNFRFHLIATSFVVICSFILQISLFEWAIILLTIGLVLVAEITNSAIEAIIDYVRPEIHPAAKVIKDAAAGSVLIAALISIIIGCIIFIPKILDLL
ncbi:diacylglycerol kinase family protein [Oceanobacillus chungangensis]|uniref:diacylglycerol kinase family protein n=1 Tax=Oceanobacillus chungangensis TaxID=1229152 RepID=UPI0014726D4D|nr:diacylglycerol kinase family protein [Oceanobacillus chungangensis]